MPLEVGIFRILLKLPAHTQALIESTANACDFVFGGQLRSLFAVGALLHPARPDRFQAPELIALVGTLQQDDLTQLAKRAGPTMQRGIRLRVLTERELHGATDVFALELADWKARHWVLRGDPGLEQLEIAPSHLRHSIEEQLRALGRRMRNRVLAGLGTRGRRDDERGAVAAGIERFVVISHHLVALVDGTAPAEETAGIERLGVLASADPAAVLAQLEEHRSRAGLKSPVGALAAFAPFLDDIIEWCDGLEVSP